MGAAENKQLMQHIFTELAKGDSRPLVESMDDDFRWVVTGNTRCLPCSGAPLQYVD